MLSVIIAMSPGREKHLSYCLAQLRQQNHTHFEVIIADDGSDFGQDIAQPFADSFLRLEYLWRPNDHNLSRSRNLGAQAALGETLLFMNNDVLLNPRALSAYLACLEQTPTATVWGYIGCRKAVTAPSLWYPELQINWLDFRFFPLGPDKIWQHAALQHRPHQMAGGHHFALKTQTWQKIGPMNEDFVHWGEEDVAYALRARLHNAPMIFLGDAWAEHICHDYHQDFHLKAGAEQAYKHTIIQELEQQLSTTDPIEMVFKTEQNGLWQQIQQHYLKHQPDALEIELSRLDLKSDLK